MASYMSTEKTRQRLDELLNEYGIMRGIEPSIGPNPWIYSKIKRFLSEKSGIPEEQLECEFLDHDRLKKYLIVFPYPLDFYLIIYKTSANKLKMFSVNGDEDIDTYIEMDIRIHDLLEAYGKAYKLNTELNSANDKIKSMAEQVERLTERVNELEYSPLPGPKFLAAQDHFNALANDEKDAE